MTRTALTLTAALLLTACGTPTTPAAQPQPAQTVTEAPSVSPSGLSLKDAGRAYLRLVGPLNDATFAVAAEQDKPSPSLPRLRRLNREFGDQAAVFLRGLAGVDWPESVREDVAMVQADVAGMMDAARQAQDAGTLAEYGEAWAGYVSNHSAQTLRAKLGLGEVPTSG